MTLRSRDDGVEDSTIDAKVGIGGVELHARRLLPLPEVDFADLEVVQQRFRVFPHRLRLPMPPTQRRVSDV